MTTKAQLLAAAKKIVAAAAKKTTKRKKNPAPRKGTKKPTRISQVTGKAPTKRLVKRRKSNKVEGYFPNPSEIKKAHLHHEMPFAIQLPTVPNGWQTFAQFATEAEAKRYAKELSALRKSPVRVIKL